MKKAYVKHIKDGLRVRGNDNEIASMMAACALALRNNGYNMDGVLQEIRLIAKPAVDETENGGANETD